jgi:pimeloyl-ACP methyl ester carboxylesterase
MSTFVLLHGAYQGPWIWQMVAERLRGKGHRVYVPCLDGCAERAASVRPGITTESQAEEVVRMLFFEDLSDVVLAGTSSGGMVMARVAEQARDKISRLVFVDALALQNGEKIRDIVKSQAATEGELAIGPTREDAAGRMFRDLEPRLRDWAADRITLHPRAVFYEPVKLESFWSQQWNASVVFCTQAVNPGEPHQRRCADALHASWHVIDTGHYPMLSEPDALAGLIESG